MGLRKITLSASDGTKTLSTSTDAEVVIKSAKITFYYTPYEKNQTASWYNQAPTGEVIIDNGPPSKIYVPTAFRDAIKMEGNGRLYKIRTEPNRDFDWGDNPLDSQQEYLHFESKVGDSTHCSFQEDPRGALEGDEGILKHQTAARYYWQTHRSYYNLGEKGTPYEVIGIRKAVNERLKALVGNKPKPFTDDKVKVTNQGPFGRGTNREEDEKHLDIYLEESNTDQGIDPAIVPLLAPDYGMKVKKPE